MSLLFCLALICFQQTSRVNAVDDGSSLSRISALSTSQLITTFAGTGQGDFNGDGILANTATIYKPAGVTFDSSGNMHIAESGGQRIRKIVAITGIISTVAGTGTRGKSLDNIAAVTAVLSTPSALAFDTLGNLFFAEENNHRVRKIDAITGIITTIAGTGDYGYYTKENVPAIGESLYSPRGVATDMFGNVYIADTSNCRIRKVDSKTGLMSTFAGNGNTRFSGEGVDAKKAGLTYPTHIAFDASGDAYITDSGNSCIRKVTVSTNIITTVAGICEKSGFLGDGDLATKAKLDFPISVTFDASGNMVIADGTRIRVVDAITKIITTTVGYGKFQYNGDNVPAETAGINPYQVAFDKSGNMYIADKANNRIRQVTTGSLPSSTAPSASPSFAPSASPSSAPSASPSSAPSASPSSASSASPPSESSASPSSAPSASPSSAPSTFKPSCPKKTRKPTSKPSCPKKTRKPTSKPSCPKKTRNPTSKPSCPTKTRKPTSKPSCRPKARKVTFSPTMV